MPFRRFDLFDPEIMLVPHFGGSCIRTLRNQWDSQGLLAMIARDFHCIFIWIFDVVFFDPEEHPTFRAFPYKHGHDRFSILPKSVNFFRRSMGQNASFAFRVLKRESLSGNLRPKIRNELKCSFNSILLVFRW